jgi:hypothetical protein
LTAADSVIEAHIVKTRILSILLLATAMVWSPFSSAQLLQDHIASSIAHENAVHPHDPGVDVSVETGNFLYKVRVVLPGDVRPASELNSRLASKWLTARGGNATQALFNREVLVQEGTVSYWVPIYEGILPEFQKGVKPGASYDLYITRLGSVSSQPVYLINKFAAVADPPDVYPLAEVVISLRRARPCPGYTVAIHGDGRVVYEGGQCGGTIMPTEWKIDSKRVVELLNHIYQIRFFRMEDEYGTREGVIAKDGMVEVHSLTLVPPDGPAITVRIGEYEKRVGAYGYSPQELVALSRMIDELAETAKWAKD